MKISIFILFLINILFSISIVLSDFTTGQINALNNIAADCGFLWNTPIGCDTISNIPSKRNIIQCDSTGNINRIDIEPTKSCGLRNEFNVFPNLKTLSLKDVNVSSLPSTIYQHAGIKYFSSSSSIYNFVSTTPGNDWSGMTSLEYLYISKGVGSMPIYPSSIVNFYYSSLDVSTLTINRLPYEVFSPNLLTFQLQSFSLLIDSGSGNTLNMLKNSTKITQLILFCNQYKVDFSVFFKLPPSLRLLQLYLLDFSANSTMPSYDQVSWNSLTTLVLNVLDIQGTFDPRFFYLPNLSILIVEDNTALVGTIPSDFGTRSHLTQLSLKNSGFFGSLPENLLFNGLEQINILSTSFSGLAPSSFLCMPASVFTQTSPTNRILIETDVFTNFLTISSRSPCVPKITSITSPIGSLDFNILITGTMLSAFPQFISVTMENINTIEALACQQKSFGTVLSCSNPFIFGTGNLTLTINNDASPLPTAKIPFSYKAPVITSITPIPTSGGTATIYGQNFWIATPSVDKYNYVELIDSDGKHVPCTNIKVINAYQTLTCYLSSGIVGGIFVASVGDQNNIDQGFAFLYQAPLITSTTTPLIPTNLASVITINGQDFWNQTQLVSVKIQGLDCPVLTVNHTILTCNFPETDFILPSGILDVTLLVNGQGGTGRNLITMMDPSFCPNNCGSNGKCDLFLGLCKCDGNFAGSDCTMTTIEVDSDLDDNKPKLQIKSKQNDTTSINVYLVSIIENQNEIFFDEWDVDEVNDFTTTYKWSGKSGQIVTVTIRENETPTKDAIINTPSNSFTYNIDYQSNKANDNPQFKFEFDARPEECQNLPFTFANPTGSSTDTRYFSLHTLNVEYFGRFPKLATINGKQGSVTSNSVGTSGQYNKMITKVNGYGTTSANFEIDLAIFSNAVNREPLLEGCILNIVDDGNNKNDTWKIGVGVGVGIGGAAILASAFFIIKQRVKLNQTQSLLDKKLKEINQNL